jgi:hypothetical protein
MSFFSLLPMAITKHEPLTLRRLGEISITALLVLINLYKISYEHLVVSYYESDDNILS